MEVTELWCEALPESAVTPGEGRYENLWADFHTECVHLVQHQEHFWFSVLLRCKVFLRMFHFISAKQRLECSLNSSLLGFCCLIADKRLHCRWGSVAGNICYLQNKVMENPLSRCTWVRFCVAFL